ncbi:MAG: hypothetical protein IJN90_00740 [Bacilli bacterium]|nr:hypothetical protein [Bacilli bacterium]
MAIQGTTKTLDTTKRDNLNTSMSSSAYISAVGVGTDPSGYAGIKSGFSTALDGAIDTYIKAINDKLDEMVTAANVSQAFRGPYIESAVKKLITALKDEAMSYTTALKEAEKAIINQVVSLYSDQSISAGESMNTDTSKLSNETQG